MEERRRIRSKMNIPMCVACVLLCLTLFSLHLLSGLYARYTANGDGGDSARVAKFAVAMEYKEGSNSTQSFANLNTTQTAEYTIVLTNNSEVAVGCTVTIDLHEDLKDAVVTIDTKAPSKIENDGKRLVFENIQMVPNNGTATCELALTVDPQGLSEKYAVGSNTKKFEWTAGFEVTANFEQID